ncbi:conserved hypothetical protein, partial [Stigmatella aurantiaca DW4/3-1]
ARGSENFVPCRAGDAWRGSLHRHGKGKGCLQPWLQQRTREARVPQEPLQAWGKGRGGLGQQPGEHPGLTAQRGEEPSRFAVHHHLHVLRGRSAAPAPGRRHRLREAPQPVHQPPGVGVLAGPHPSPGQGVHLGLLQLPGLGRVGDEGVISGIHPGLHGPLLLGGPRPPQAQQVGQGGAGQGLLGDPQLVLQQALERGLQVEDADAAGERGGVGEDFIRGHGRVVAARGGHIPHGGDDGLHLLGLQHRAVHQVRGEHVPSARVHPEDDGHHGGVHLGPVQGERHRLRPGDAGGPQRILTALAPGDGAQHGHDGDAAAAAPARLLLIPWGVVLRVGGPRNQLLQPLLQLLLALEDAVDEPQGLGDRGRNETHLPGLPQPLHRQLALAHHRLLVPVHLRVQPGVERLALRLAHVPAGELLGRRLVFAHPRHVPGHAQLLHRAPHAGDARRQAVDEERGGGQRVEPVRGRGDKVALVVAGEHQRQHLLARGAQPQHGLAQLLRPAPVHPAQPLHLQHHASQPLVLGGQLQEAHQPQVRVRPGDAEQRQRGAHPSGEPVVEVHQRHHPRGTAQAPVGRQGHAQRQRVVQPVLRSAARIGQAEERGVQRGRNLDGQRLAPLQAMRGARAQPQARHHLRLQRVAQTPLVQPPAAQQVVHPQRVALAEGAQAHAQLEGALHTEGALLGLIEILGDEAVGEAPAGTPRQTNVPARQPVHALAVRGGEGVVRGPERQRVRAQGEAERGAAVIGRARVAKPLHPEAHPGHPEQGRAGEEAIAHLVQHLVALVHVEELGRIHEAQPRGVDGQGGGFIHQRRGLRRERQPARADERADDGGGLGKGDARSKEQRQGQEAHTRRTLGRGLPRTSAERYQSSVPFTPSRGSPLRGFFSDTLRWPPGFSPFQSSVPCRFSSGSEAFCLGLPPLRAVLTSAFTNRPISAFSWPNSSPWSTTRRPASFLPLCKSKKPTTSSVPWGPRALTVPSTPRSTPNALPSAEAAGLGAVLMISPATVSSCASYFLYAVVGLSSAVTSTSSGDTSMIWPCCRKPGRSRRNRCLPTCRVLTVIGV